MLLESCYDEQGVEDWFYGFANMEGENRERNLRIWSERRNMTGRPTVVGIAAYWIAFHKGKSIEELFDEYVRPKEEAYYKRHRSEGKSYGKDLQQEFYDNYIILKEALYNKLSEAIYEYITPEDIQRLKDVMDAFIEYLRQKSTHKKDHKQTLPITLHEYLEYINNAPLMIENIGYVVAGAKFELCFMEAIIRGIREEWLMDKAIQLITDSWYEYFNREEDCCYHTVETIPVYHADKFGRTREDLPLKMPKYLNIEKDLECIKEDELKRRKIHEEYEKKRAEINDQELDHHHEMSDSKELKENEEEENEINDTFARIVTKPAKADGIYQQLKEFLKGKIMPKDITKPIRAAMDAGAIRRPTWREFCVVFGYETNNTWKSAYSKYTNPNLTKNNHPYITDEAFQIMKNEFLKILQ